MSGRDRRGPRRRRVECCVSPTEGPSRRAELLSSSPLRNCGGRHQGSADVRRGYATQRPVGSGPSSAAHRPCKHASMTCRAGLTSPPRSKPRPESDTSIVRQSSGARDMPSFLQPPRHRQHRVRPILRWIQGDTNIGSLAHCREHCRHPGGPAHHRLLAIRILGLETTSR